MKRNNFRVWPEATARIGWFKMLFLQAVVFWWRHKKENEDAA